MRQSGRTMLETIAVLGIMALITIGAISMYTRSKNNLTRMKVFDEVADISENIKTLFQGKTNYNQLSLSYLERYGAIKNRRNAYSKDFEIKPSGDGRSFEIIYNELSEEDCIYYGLSQWQGASDVFLNGISAIKAETTKDLTCQKGSTNTLTIRFD